MTKIKLPLDGKRRHDLPFQTFYIRKEFREDWELFQEAVSLGDSKLGINILIKKYFPITTIIRGRKDTKMNQAFLALIRNVANQYREVLKSKREEDILNKMITKGEGPQEES